MIRRGIAGKRRQLTVIGSLAVAAAMAGACSDSSSKMTLTVYEDAPIILPVDVGTPGNSPGDAYYFHAPIHDRPGGPQTGELFGTKTLVKQGTAESPSTEQRATLLFFTFNDRRDQIVVAGVPDYPPNAPEFSSDTPVLRAVLGGTGRYNGVRGQLTSTRHPDGSYTQQFSLKT